MLDITTRFTAGEGQWRAGLGSLRQAVRQELVTRQLAHHVPAAPARVLDIGCGQGTQALALARAGHHVTGLDASGQLLSDFEAAADAHGPDVRARVRLVHGDGAQAVELVGAGAFDLVLCHGVLMYLTDPGPMLDAVTGVCAPGGVVSLLVRNGDALAMRPGMHGDWAAADAAFDGAGYRNRIGVDARADRLGELAESLVERGVEVDDWYGVRVFTDTAASDAQVPADPGTWAALLRAEERAGATDPYRGVAALLHVVGRKRG